MTIFRPLQYTENPLGRTFQRIERFVTGDEVLEQLGPIYRVATPEDPDSVTSVVVYDPEDFEPRRLVPIQPGA